MARISSYQNDNNISGDDKLLGSDSTSSTRNFLISDLADFLNNNGYVTVSRQLNLKFETSFNDRYSGSFLLSGFGGDQSNISDITSIVASKKDFFQNDNDSYVTSVFSGTIFLVDTSDLNNYGEFRVTSLTENQQDADFYDINLEHVSSNGILNLGSYFAFSRISETNVDARRGLIDSTGSKGSSGQILSSNGSGTDWVDLTEISGVNGSGTANYVAKWSDGDSITDSSIYDNGTNVGIGTSSPSYKLQVGGTVNADKIFIDNTTDGHQIGKLIIDYQAGMNPALRSSGNDYIRFNNSILLGGNGDNIKASTNHSEDLYFMHQRSGDFGYRFTTADSGAVFRITGAGNVGIGTTSPTARLEVANGVSTDYEMQVGTANNFFVNNMNPTVSSVHIGYAGYDYVGGLYLGLNHPIYLGSGTNNRIQAPTTHALEILGYQSLKLQTISTSLETDYYYKKLSFFVDGAEKFRIDSAGKVGIGTTSPRELLEITKYGNPANIRLNQSGGTIGPGDVLGSIQFSGEDVQVPTDQQVGASISGVSETGWGAGSEASTALVFSTRRRELDAPIEYMRLNHLGDLGIGTSTPTAKLHIAGNIKAQLSELETEKIVYYDQATEEFTFGAAPVQETPTLQSVTDAGNTTTNQISSGSHTITQANTQQLKIHYGGGNPIWALTGASYFAIEKNFSRLLHINSSNRFGIGTTSPTGKMDIIGGTSNVLRLKGANDENEYVLKATTNDDIESLWVGGTGNVGIGTTTPAEKLEVDGNIKISEGSQFKSIATQNNVNATEWEQSLEFFLPYRSDGTTVAENKSALKLGGTKFFEPRTHNTSVMHVYGGLSFASSSSSGGSGIRLYFGDQSDTYPANSITTSWNRFGNTTDRQADVYGYFGASFSSTQPSGYFKFSNSTGELFRISSNGNVGIGTTSPSHKLHVKNGSNDLFLTRDVGTAVRIGIGNSNPSYAIDLGTYSDNAIGGIKYLRFYNGTDRLDVSGNGRFGFKASRGYFFYPTTDTPSGDIYGVAIRHLRDSATYTNDDVLLVEKSDGTDLFSVKSSGNVTIAGAATFDSDLTVQGNLTVNGTTTTLNTTELTIEDKNIVLANGAVDAAAAAGAGITIDGADATLTYNSSGDLFEYNKNLKVIYPGGGREATLTGFQLLFSRNSYNYVQATDASGRIRIVTGGNLASSATADFLENKNSIFYGNVGIGTTAPSELLHLSSTTPLVRFDDTNSGLHYIVGQDGDGFKFTTNNPAQFSKYVFDARLQLTGYGSGAHTGTAAYTLRVDSSGNVIETPIGAGAIDGSGTDNYLAKWSDADTITDSIIYDDSTSVGIGTTSPSAKLHIEDEANPRLLVKDSNGAGIYTQAYNGYGILSTLGSTSYLTFGINDTEKMRLTADGKLGIGWTAPPAKLSVSGGNSSGDSNTLYIASAAYNGNLLNQAHSPHVITLLAGKAETGGNNLATSLKLVNTGTETAGGTFADIRSRAYGEIDKDITNLVNFKAEYRNWAPPTGPSTLTNHYGVQVLALGVNANGTVTNNYGIYLSPGTTATNNFGVYQAGSSVDNYFQGNVAIGTGSTPVDQLSVRGASAGSITIGGSAGTTGDEFGALKFYQHIAGHGVGAKITATKGSNWVSGNLLFHTGENNVTSPNMIITSTGRVGIGTTSPDTTLHLASSTTTGPTLRLSTEDSNTFRDDINGTIEFETRDSSNAGVNASIVGIQALAGEGAIALSAGKAGSLTQMLTVKENTVIIGSDSSLTNIQNKPFSSGTNTTGERLSILQDPNKIYGIAIVSESNSATTTGIGFNPDSTKAPMSLIAVENAGLLGEGHMHFVVKTGDGTYDPAALDDSKMVIKNSGNIGIGTTSPDASAILDIASTTQGVLFPRMTEGDRTSINSPATGLIVYQTDGDEGLYIYKSTGWIQII